MKSGVPLHHSAENHVIKLTFLVLHSMDFIWQCNQTKIISKGFQVQTDSSSEASLLQIYKYKCKDEEIALGIGSFPRYHTSGSVVTGGLMVSLLSVSGWILDFRRAQNGTDLSLCTFVWSSHAHIGELHVLQYICWQVSVLDVVPLAFALDKLLSTPRSETDSSIIRTIINVTFSF